MTGDGVSEAQRGHATGDGVSEARRVPVAGGALALVLHTPPGSAARPCVVACHGLGASKDSDKYLQLAAEFTRDGLSLARFDFQGCGESTGREDMTTVASRIADLLAVLAHLRADPRLDGRLGLLGSSMGGFVAIHAAAALPAAVPVVTWNAPASLRALAEPERRDDGTGIGPPFLAELASGRYAETPAGVPWHLVVQGGADAVVAPHHGAALHARAAAPRELLGIAGADHRLTEPGHRARAVAASLAWFRRAWA